VLSAHGSGVKLQSVRCGWCRRARVLVVGGNGRVQTSSDTWLSPKHRMLGVVRPVASCSESGAHEFCPVKGQHLV